MTAVPPPVPPEIVWVVSFGADPLPHERWSSSRFFPFVEVYAKWGDAQTRWGDLHDKGIAALMEEVVIR